MLPDRLFDDIFEMGPRGQKEKMECDIYEEGANYCIEASIAGFNKEDIKVIDDKSLDAYVIPVSEKEINEAILLTSNLRDNAFSVDMDYTNKKMNAKFKEADRYNAKFIIILGEEEIKDNKITIKDNLTKEEVKIERDNLIDYLDVNI